MTYRELNGTMHLEGQAESTPVKKPAIFGSRTEALMGGKLIAPLK
jgi:hypothetical protein